VVRETSSRDRYRKLKRDITAKLTYERCLSTAAISKSAASVAASYRALTNAALLPLTVVALPTIRESSNVAKCIQFHPQTPRTRSLVGPNPPACCRSGHSVRPLCTLRPARPALPMRSWNSDDSNFLSRCGTRSDITHENGAAKRARLCRYTCVDETRSADIEPTTTPPTTIPIIISSSDDCDSETLSGRKIAELLPTQRRSSWSFPAYDVVETDTDSEQKVTSLGHDYLKSRKRRRDFVLSVKSYRRASLQPVTASARHIAIDEEQETWPLGGTKACGHHEREFQTVRAATCVNGVRQSSTAVDDTCTTRRLSLPHSSVSATDHSRLQLPAS